MSKRLHIRKPSVFLPELTDEQLAKEQRHQQAVLEIRKKYGKNAILRGMNLQEGATARERNQQIGGHKA